MGQLARELAITKANQLYARRSALKAASALMAMCLMEMGNAYPNSSVICTAARIWNFGSVEQLVQKLAITYLV